MENNDLEQKAKDYSQALIYKDGEMVENTEDKCSYSRYSGFIAGYVSRDAEVKELVEALKKCIEAFGEENTPMSKQITALMEAKKVVIKNT
jgi:mevalonate kinase